MNESLKKRSWLQNQAFWLVLAALVGVIAFLALYTAVPLDVTNDEWFLMGYDETDIQQHYAGWIAYRLSPWRFPLGMAEKLAAGSGTIISFTDSIPWAAIFFRLLRRFLPQTFQYFGIYGLLCFMLQGVAAWLLLRHYTGGGVFPAGNGIVLFFPGDDRADVPPHGACFPLAHPLFDPGLFQAP